MANILDLRSKITSTKNTGQITKALEMVSAARQKKAQEFLLNSRFLRSGVNELMQNIERTRSIDPSSLSTEELKYFHPNNSSKVLIITVMSQRGLCGSMNSNLFYQLIKFKEKSEKQVHFVSVNKVAQKYLRNFKENIEAYFSDIPENQEIDVILPIANFVKDNFSKYERIYLGYTEFIKSGIFEPKLIQLLPIETEGRSNHTLQTGVQEFSVEPDPITLLNALANLYIELEIYEAILSNQASEHSARMIAMKKASDNVNDIVTNLTLVLNKERQAKITQQMAEISANL